MRSIVAFSLGILASCLVFAAVSGAPAAIGGDDCAPGGAKAGPPAAGAPAEAAKPPAHEPALTSALLAGIVGEWTCDCSYPTGGHAAGDANVRLVLDGTALMTESALEWTVGDKTEKVHNLGIWKVGADGKALSYWGFSSHDGTADLLTGTLSDTSADVTGMTHWGPMRLTLSLKDGNLAQQLWIDHKDMGVISFKKK